LGSPLTTAGTFISPRLLPSPLSAGVLWKFFVLGFVFIHLRARIWRSAVVLVDCSQIHGVFA
jgi:hypothetical protein